MKNFTVLKGLLILAGLMFGIYAGGLQAQVTVTVTNPTNTTPNLAASYGSLASAISALSGITVISGPVTLTAANGTETAPAGGFVINFTATTSLANYVVVQGSGSTVITAPNPQTSGNLNDAIFKIIGSDFVSIQNFTMQENAANTTTAAGTNNMTEWGVALLYASTTNGCQNITIQNNTISLNRTYQNTFGIYANSTHSATAVTTAATATGANGGNHNLKIYSNSISNVNMGMVIVGPTAAADQNNIVEIGGTAGTANTITNFGTTGTISSYVNVSGTVNGIILRNSINFTISYNTITSSVGGTTSGTLNGIQIPASSNAPTTTFTNNINNNDISLRSGLIAGAINGISYPSGSASATSTLNVNNNNFNTFGHTVAGTAAITFITVASANQFTSISNNTFTNINVNTTGSVTFISHSFTMPAGGTQTLSNNAIVTGFTKTGAGGTVTLMTTGASSPTGTTATYSNNNFSNINVTGATTITGITSSDGTASTVSNKIFTGNTFNQWTGGTSAITVLTVSYWGGVSSITGNSITNITGQGAITGISMGSSGNLATSLTVGPNTINNLSSTGTGGAVNGITCANTSSLINIAGNTINTLSSTGASAVNGIAITGATLTNVYKNKIYDLAGSNASSTVNGILISAGTTVNVYNNYVGDLRTPAANAANPLIGLSITGGTTVNAYYNTVYLNGASTGALFGSSAVSVSSTPTVTLRNNIFVNTSSYVGATGFTVAHRRSSSTLTSYGSSSNNNDFYAGTPGANNLIYYDGTNSVQTMALYKTFAGLSPRDAGSVSENPNWVSTTGSLSTFLHINTTIATQLEGGGAAISGYTDDYDGDTRNVSTPDIGADEFAGIALDLTPPNVNYTLLSNTASLVDRVLTATITDATGVPTSGSGLPVLYWKINAGAYAGVTGVSIGSNQYTFTFGAGVAATDVVSYYIVSQDICLPPNVGSTPSSGASGFTADPPLASTPPASPSTYTILSPICGTKTIGTSGPADYATITAAVADLNAKEITCPVVFNLIDATYPTETFPITINANSGSSAVNTVTFKPAATVTTTITGAVAAGSIFKLNGADYIIIDGSNSGGSDRSLTIENTTTTTSGNAVVWIASPALGNGSNNNTVKNCIIQGNSATTTFLGMYIGGNATISLTAAGTELNNNNTVSNNLFRKTQYGLALFGYAAATPDLNNVVSNNSFGTALAGEGFALAAINADRQSGLAVSGNEIQNITNATTSSNMFGIRLLDFKNGLCYNNSIHDMLYTGASTPKLYGIAVTSSSYTTVGNPSQCQVHNNIIYKLNSSGTSSVWNITGILASAGYGDKYYHNSVNLTGQLANSSSGLCAAFANGDGNITSVGSNIDVRNNIFSLTGSSATAGGNFWAYYSAASTVAGSTLNYNNLYCNGTNATNNIGRFNSTNHASLAAWQTATSQEANSLSVNPQYNSSTNLRCQPGSPVLAMGTPVGVTTDILGLTRSITNPSMGAYELGYDLTGPEISYTALSNTSSTAGRVLIATITDPSSVPTSGSGLPTLYWKIGAGTYSAVTGVSLGSNQYSFTFGTGVVATDVVSYYIAAQDIAAPANVGTFPGGASGFTTDPPAATTPPAAPSTYTILGTICGNKTVGTAGDYATLTLAIADLNGKEIICPVVFTLLDATYPTETYPITINANPGSSAVNTVTIKPATGITTTITGSSASALIILNGADYVTIDGSNDGTSSRNLTLINTNTGTSSALIWLQNTATPDGATNNTVKNCILTGNSNTTTLFGVGSGSSTISITSVGTGNNNNSYINNSISKTQYGIFSQGASAANKNQGTIIQNNLMNTLTPNNIAKGGIQTGYENNIIISGNTIDGITQTASLDVFGIALGLTSFSTSTFIGNEVTNATVYNNIIGGITHTNTYSAGGITLAPATSGTTNIYNNIISGVGANGTAGDYAGSIILGGGTGSTTNVYYNSISMTGTLTGGSGPMIGIAVAGGYPVVNLSNNISYITQTNGTGKQYAIGLVSATPISNFSSNYNDFYTTASGFSCTGGLGTTDATTLALWTAATGQDANSLSVVPQFITTTDLRCQLGSPVLAAGTPIGGITNDILGTTRSLTTPSLGAYENGIDMAAPAITYTVLGNHTSLTTRNVSSIAITDPSGINTVAGTMPRLYFKRSTNTNAFNDNTNATDGWKYVEANGTTSPFDFTIDYSLINGAAVALGDIFQYFIVAQDAQVVPFIAINSGTFAAAPTSVALTSAAFPIGGTINQYTIVAPISGTFNIPSGTYKSLTDNATGQPGSPGIFQMINNSALNGDITIIIDGDLIETGTNALNQFSEVLPGNYTIYINSDGTSRTISQTVGGIATPMININGADRVTIDGGASKNLTFRNTHATPATAKAAIQFINGATNDILTNCIIESNATTTTQGAVLISTGTNNVQITANTIHDATLGTTGSPSTGIYSGSTSNTLTINNNSISNFTGIGIYLFSAADGCTVSGNSLFNNLATPPSTTQTGIYLGSGNNHNINGNYIGGQAVSCGGLPWTNSGVITFTGIYSTGSSTAANTISNNTIQNISLSNTGSAPFIGINLIGGKAIASNNLIGHATTAGSINIAGTATTIGINSVNADITTINANTLANITQSTSGSASYFDGIWVAGAANKTISNNKIYKCGPTSASTGTNSTVGIYIPGATGTQTYTVVNNMISLGHGISNNHGCMGIDNAASTNNIVLSYFNSISIGGTGTGSSASYAYLKRTSTNETLLNNNFQNERSGGTGKHYAIGCTNTSGTSSSNYNNLIATGATGGNTGIYSSTVCLTLDAWRTASSRDANSISAVTTFTDIPNGDLHASATNDCHLDGTGTDVSGFNTDYDGQTRTSPPDIGADEFTGIIPPVAVSGGNQRICFGTATPDLTASGTGTLIWYSNPGLTTLAYTGTTFATGLSAVGLYTYYVTNNFGNCASAPITITLTIDATTVGGSVGTDHAVCYGTDGGTLTLSGHTGDVVRWEYSTDAGFSWTPIVNTTTSHAVGNLTVETMFRAVVLNGLCLEANSNPATLTINPLPTPSASSNSPRCVGTSLNLSVLPNGMNSYSWTGPDGFTSGIQNPTVDPVALASAGTYSVTVTDANSCQGTANTTVVVHALPVVYAVGGSGTYCNGVNGKSVTLANSDVGISYELFKNAIGTGQTFVGNNGIITWNNCLSGTYTVVATNTTTLCQQTMSGSAVVTEDPSISALVSPDPAYNQINTGLTLHGNPSGGTGVFSTHTWTGATTYLNNTGIEGPVFTGTSTGNFTLTYTVTDDHGCTASDQISVAVSNPPANPVMPGQVRCGTGTLLMTASVGLGGDAVQFSLDGSSVISTDNTSPFEYTTPSVIQGTTTTIYARSINTTTGFVSSWMNAGAQADLPTVGGTASPVAATICNNASSTVNLADQTGTVLYWERNFNGGSWTSIGNAGLTSINTGSLTPVGTYGFRAVVQSGVCPSVNSIPAYILVNQVIASAVVSNVSCNGGSNGTINMTESGGTSPYLYSWSNGPSTQDINGLQAGTYTVTVTDALSCVGTNSWTVTEPNLLQVSAVVTPVFCYNGSTGSVNITVAGGTAPFTYSWSNSAVSEDISGLIAGTYSVTVTDALGCTTSGLWNVTEPSAALSSTALVSNVSCFNGLNGTINMTVNGGTPGYTYLWSNGAVTQDLSGVAAGTYFVTITDTKSCVLHADYTITQPPVLNVNAFVGNVTIPGGNNGYINLTPVGGTPGYTYHWSNNSSSQNLNNLFSGIYLVTITDQNLCTKTATYLVTEPNQININSNITDASCYGGTNGAIDLSISGGTSPYSYAWSNGAVTEDISGIGAGLYTITITDFNGAIKAANFLVSSPPAIAGSVAITNNGCYGASVGAINLTISGGVGPYTYNWSSGSSAQDISGLVAGYYTVTVTDANLCTYIHGWNVNEPAGPITFNPQTTNINCFGGNNGSINLNTIFGTAPYTYLWSNGATTEINSGLIAGTYSVTVTDANSCIKTGSFTLTQPAAAVSVTASAVNANCNAGASGILNAVATGGTAPYTYLWSNGLNGAYQTGIPAGTYSVTVTDFKGCTAVSSATIGQPSAISLSVNSTNVSCFGGNNGTIQVTPSGGVPPYSYTWSNATYNNTVSNLLPGSYTVTVSDANFCPKIQTVTITQPSALTVSASLTHVLCNGAATGKIILTPGGGVGPYTYLWSNGAVSKDLNGIIAGTYQVTVTDANLCTKTGNWTITQATQILSTVVQTDVNCNGGNNGALDLSVSGGVSPYTYLWSTGATSQDIGTLIAGIYTVTITDANLCPKISSWTITQPNVINPTALTSAVSCFGGANGSINVTVTGGVGPYTYLWSNGSTANPLTGLIAATYSVTVTDAHLCPMVSNWTVTQPANPLEISAVSSPVLCFGSQTGSLDLSVSGGTPGYTYLWSNGATTQDISNLPAGNYSVTVTDNNGCVAINSWNVTQPAIALGATAGLTHVLCFGGNNGAVNITVTGGNSPYSYAWSNGSPNEDLNNLITGNYTVTVTDASQCVLIRTYTINQPLNPLSTSALMSPVLCFGGNTGSINLSVSGGTPNYTFLWSNGAVTEDISGLIAGTYSVTVTDANGCITTDSKTVTQPTAAIALSTVINNVSCFGGSNGSIILTVSGGTPAYTYLWSTGAVTKDINTLSNGSYSVTVTDANGCVKTQSYTVTQPAAALSATAVLSPVLCYNGNTGSINLTPAGGTSPYTFLWSNAATTEDISGLSAIAYTVTITDFKACTKVSSWTVSQPAAVLNVSGALTHILCNGASTGGIVQTPVGGTSPYTYLWSGGITTKDRTGLAAGTYAVTVTDANGCTKTASYTLNQPSLLNATGIVTNVNCSGQSNGAINVTTSGGTSPYTWLWNDNNLQEDRTGLLPGNYSVTITDNNNCPITRSFSVSTNYTTPVVSMSIPYQQVCSGGLSSEILFSSDVPGTTYSWTSSPNTVLSGFIPGGTGNIPEQTIHNSGPVNSSITYTIIPTANACQGSPVNHTITVYPMPTASINGSATICTGNTAQLSINLTGNGPWTLTYNNGVSNISIPNITTSPYIMNVSPLVSTTYTLLSARDIHNCFGQIVQPAATITVVPKPTVSLSGNASICYGESAVVNFNLTGTPPWNLTWSDGSLHQITGILTSPYSLSIMPAVSTTISVTALSDSYCTGVNFGSPVNVLVKPLPTAVLNGSQSVCPGQPAILSVQLTGIAPWSVSYTNGASVVTVNNILTSTYTFSVNPTLSTTYSLISVNDANCSGTVSGSAQVVINTLPSASLSGPAQICSGSPLTLTVGFTGTGPWTFTWFNGTSHTVSNVMSNPYSFTTIPVANTNYSITAVSDAYCSGTNFGQALSVVVKPLPTARILNSLSICPGSNAVLTIQLTGTAPWSVTIHDGVSTTISGITSNSFSYTVNPAVTTTYNLLSVTDANCQGTIIGNPATVSIYPVPVLNTAGINQSNTLCSGGIMSFTAHFTSGTPPFTLSYLNHQNMPVNVTNLNEGSLVSIVPPISQGAYTYNLVSITDANGCVGQINYPFVLLVFPEPIAVAGPDLTVSLGNSVTLNGMALGGTAPYQYMWNPPVYLNNPIISNPECTPLATTQYSLTVIDFNGCISTDNMTVYVTNALASVYGTITYANTDNTPLSPVKVYVRNPQNVPVDSTITNASGFYSFANLPVGNYHLDIVTFKEPGGINSTDAMLVISHFAQMQTLTGLYNKAADVDGNNFLNSLDALLIARYFTNSLSSFPAGQWIFDQVNFSIPTISSLYNVNGLCYGDVNGSYIPTLKAEPSVNMSLEGSIKVNLAETIEIPVTTDMNMHTNAISMIIEYPENDLRIEDVILTNSAEPVLYTFNDGILRISWYSLNGMFINEGEPVFTIHAKPLSTLDVPYLSCTGNSEFADIFGTVAHNVKLRYPAIQISNESIHVNSMYPVPANDIITIELELSKAESVVIEIYTNTGDLVSVEKLSKLEKGLNSVELNLSSVPAGSYICAIRTENQEYSKPVIRKKLLIIR